VGAEAVRVAAYQAPLDACYDGGALGRIREQITECEKFEVDLLCCPEAVLGGLADYVDDPARIALARADLPAIAASLASETTAVIVGFTELGDDERLYNAAAVMHRGDVVGYYRKLHPAINKSVYDAGCDTPVFTVKDVTIGILICRDTTFPETARAMISRGAAMLFVPTNNGMPETRGGRELINLALETDIAIAREHGVPVIRADATGRSGALISYGATSIVDHLGKLVCAAQPMETGLITANVEESCANTNAV
jgi:predicted amidohydrolase